MKFVGQGKNQIEFVIDGTLLAPANPRDIKKDTWINFRYINDLYISGAGTLNGQGKQSWPLNDCHKTSTTMGFAFVTNSRINRITSLNSKIGITITAPGDSPNTDSIKLGFSSNIHISNTVIGTGDDCITIFLHMISVRSLGKNQDEKDVTDLTVKDIVFNGTSDGIRIKTWDSSALKIIISKFVFENIQMINVEKLINIDQKYCPHPPCEKKGDSHVQIQDLKLKNIYGTSMNKVVSFLCKNVVLIDINIEHNGVDDGLSTAMCENVDGSAHGKMVPQHCMR
ncbi:unnamed protein product [Thlaspi arvense]|uniref:Polygalacturonase n=1 Tax=Thlaspi arvense TaxID=13288 RepID=A0AAU9T8J2_THLAR|nr:unnamed protein product [Thlaspi arvense]